MIDIAEQEFNIPIRNSNKENYSAAEFGLHPDCFRLYLKEHEEELHSTLGKKKGD